jgi:hypothetical protein
VDPVLEIAAVDSFVLALPFVVAVQRWLAVGMGLAASEQT